MNLQFEQPRPISKNEALLALSSDCVDVVATTLVRIALWEPDWPWAEDIFLKSLGDKRKEVRSAALTSLGHLARLHRTLHVSLVLPAITELLIDPDCAGVAQDALNDIRMFVRD